jgi:N-ethylmaleimide reductase
MSTTLFSPLGLGQLNLGHRVVMAPLTRMRADHEGDLPNEMMRQYYGQRASQGGLIISEAISISRATRGYLGAPGLYADDQTAAWRPVVDTVHANGALFVAQLWHVGRTSHASLNEGAAPITASDLPYQGVAFTAEGWLPTTPARALDSAEIPGVLALYADAARRAMEAGFDGVELHAANGYLLDQFLQDGSNKRADRYGGPVENRARLLFEVIDTVRGIWPAGRIGVRISPSSSFNDMADSDPDATFGYLADALSTRGLAYLHVVEPRVVGSEEAAPGLAPVAARKLRLRFKGPVIAAGGFDGAEAQREIAGGHVDAVAFGRHFIANPDLPERLRQGIALNDYDRASFYGGGREGYTDYPFASA